MKKNIKTESVQEFLARGGKIQFCDTPSEKKRRSYKRKDQEESKEDEVDMELVPNSLKIALGLR